VEVLASAVGDMSDVVEDVERAEEDPSGDLAHGCGLGVVGDDAVTLAEEIGELVELDQRCGHIHDACIAVASHSPVASWSSAIARRSRLS